MKDSIALNTIVSLILTVAVQTAIAQGPLTPPGAPAPTMKTLDQVEVRTPITNLPYTITQPGSYYLIANLTGTAVITIASVPAASSLTQIRERTICFRRAT